MIFISIFILPVLQTALESNIRNPLNVFFGKLFKILIGFILCLEFWTLGKTQCVMQYVKQCVKHVSMMSPRVTDISRKPLLKQRVSPFPRQLPGARILNVARDIRGNGHLLQSKNRNTVTANSFAN
jgi:hypothetical protein